MNWLTGLFSKRMVDATVPSIKSVQFDTSNWQVRESHANETYWTNKHGDSLSFVFVQKPPTFPGLSDIAGLRAYGRRLASNDGKVGGIVSVEVVKLRDLPAVQIIYKYEQLPAYGYTGLVLLSFPQFYYVVAISSVERGRTGGREAFVTAQLAERGELKFEKHPGAASSSERIDGWFQDPYDANYDGVVLRSIADHEKYDSVFLEHPLSKVRTLFRQVQTSLKYDERILHATAG